MATDWSYQYDTSGDFGAWQDDGQLRFGYQYLSGQWWDKGSCGDWALGQSGSDRFAYAYDSGQWSDFRVAERHNLGAAGLGSAFVSDGLPHALAEGFTYHFDGTYGYSWYDDYHSFRQLYSSGEWQYGDVSGWHAWSATTFVADAIPGSTTSTVTWGTVLGGSLYFLEVGGGGGIQMGRRHTFQHFGFV